MVFSEASVTFMTSHQSYLRLWGDRKKITYCAESTVLNLCKVKKSVISKNIYFIVFASRIVFCYIFKDSSAILALGLKFL